MESREPPTNSYFLEEVFANKILDEVKAHRAEMVKEMESPFQRNSTGSKTLKQFVVATMSNSNQMVWPPHWKLKVRKGKVAVISMALSNDGQNNCLHLYCQQLHHSAQRAVPAAGLNNRRVQTVWMETLAMATGWIYRWVEPMYQALQKRHFQPRPVYTISCLMT